jgi:hypothetical protein
VFVLNPEVGVVVVPVSIAPPPREAPKPSHKAHNHAGSLSSRLAEKHAVADRRVLSGVKAVERATQAVDRHVGL